MSLKEQIIESIHVVLLILIYSILIQNNSFNYYFESVISYGFYPKITLPTRIDSREGINNPSTTLIDNIFCSNSDDLDSSVSGVIS